MSKAKPKDGGQAFGSKPPNPGSKEAIGLGCTCAVLDNNHGKFPPYPPHGWWFTASCPVHDPEGTLA